MIFTCYNKGFSLTNWITKKMNPDASIADTGGKMEAYYDEKLKRWIFPDDDPDEVAKPLAPPPIIPAKKNTEGNDDMQTPSKAANNDPLASLMAPPSRTPNSLGTKGGSDPIANLMAPPRGGLARSHYSEPRVKSSRGANLNLPASARKASDSSNENSSKPAAPHFVIFQPPPATSKTEEKED